MGTIFFNLDEKFEQVAEIIFNALDVKNYGEGDSANVLGGYYFSHTIFGIRIKLEMNSYGYEDQYQFMIGIGKDFVRALDVSEQDENMVSNMVISLLSKNLKIPIACEKDDKLIVVSPGDNTMVY